ncbi:ABC transporter substrate-binding protein [Natronosalvus caseinilyticus]|uniref:ABC transporter substrate-binding protein n=1 Tax=Natronosalvus caseinilyticus TaxID=2953747 RepID=UPI0028A81255|nr:ABC transporter substrate-binding protein [Natronosalvus caseinilyticus]
MRIVTTLPSATEIVCALGLEPVGVSHECDFPPAVRDCPSVTASRIDADASSGAIDEQVLEAVSGTDDGAGDGVYDVAVDTLDALDPDLVVTQGMCDVCAVDEVVVERALEEIAADPEVLTTDPHSIADVLADVERVGEAAGVPERARDAVAALEERIDAVRTRTADLALDERPRVAVFDWTDPVMIAGHWTAELVEWASGRYGLADVGEPSRPRAWDEIRAYDPEIAVVAPCGFDLEQTAANLTDLTDREGWDDLTAVREGCVWALDGNQYLNRPGPRLVDTLEALAPIVQPDRFPDPPDESVAVPLEVLDRGPEVDA